MEEREPLSPQELAKDITIMEVLGAIGKLASRVGALVIPVIEDAAEQASIPSREVANTFEEYAEVGRAMRDVRLTPPPPPSPDEVLTAFERLYGKSVRPRHNKGINAEHLPEGEDLVRFGQADKEVGFAAEAMGMGDREFQRWMTMARPVAYGSNRHPGEVLTDMINVWSGPGQELAVAARAVDVVTDDLDALDRMARLSTDPRSRRLREEQDQEVRELRMDRVEDQMAHTEIYTAAGLPDYKVGVFRDLEDDLGLTQTAASHVAAATNDVDDIWAHFREQGGARHFSPEGIEYGAWGFERSLAPTRDLTSHLRAAAADAPWARTPNFAVLAQDAADAASFELSELENPLLGTGGRVPVSAEDMGNELEHTANFAIRMQDAVEGASFELWELENPLLRTRDVALGLADAMGSGYGGDGVTGAMDGAGLAADGLALSTGTAEQALLAAGLTGDSTTQVLDLMRSAGLDPATSAWGELATAVHVWGDATDTEVDRVIGRLGELASVQGGGGPGSGGSRGGGGADDRTQRGLDQLMALARTVAVRRADMGDLNPQHIAHELGKLPGQLRGPGSLEEKLALLRLFFAGGAHGIAFGLGPSASDLGVNIPQFAGGGAVPGPLGAPQLIVAHGGEHIVPHRATGSPTIIRIELDREVLAQAVLGDLLRLQGREVTLGLS